MPINERTNSTSRSSLDPTDETINNVSSSISSRTDSSASYEVRPDEVTTEQLSALTPELGEMVYDTTVNENKYWNGTEWVALSSTDTVNDRVNEHSQGYLGLLSPFYFGGVATDTIVGEDDVDNFVDVELIVDANGVFDNRPTDMKEDASGYEGTGAAGDPYIFSLEGLDTTSFATFRVSMDFTPEEDEGQLESRILFDRHTGTSPSEQFSIEEVTLSMQQGADIPYTAEPLLSFFIGDSIDTNAVGDAGKVRFQIKSDVEGTLRVRALTLYVNK